MDADISAAASLIAEPARAAMLLALTEADALPATELARRASVSQATASSHLAKLLDGGLVVDDRHGRHRYFRLADPAVARALEALAVVAPQRPVRSLRDAAVGDALRTARTCYDHLAGRLGVALTDALRFERVEGDLAVTRVTRRRLGLLGVDVDDLAELRRPLARACLDWSERRYHVAGAVGAAVANRVFELRWIERLPGSRAVRVTRRGAAGLADLGVRL